MSEINVKPEYCIDARHCQSKITQGNDNFVKFRGSNGQLFSIVEAKKFFEWYQTPSAVREATELLENCEGQSFDEIAEAWKATTKVDHPQLLLFKSIKKLQLANAPTIVHHLQCAKKAQYGLDYSHGKFNCIHHITS